MVYHISVGKRLTIQQPREDTVGTVVVIGEHRYSITADGLDDADTSIRPAILAVFEKTMEKYTDALERLAQ